MTTRDDTVTTQTPNSKGESVSELATASARVSALEPSSLWWANTVLVLIGVAAIVGALYAVASVISTRKSNALNTAKSDLIAVQERLRSKERDEFTLALSAQQEQTLKAQKELLELRERIAYRVLDDDKLSTLVTGLKTAASTGVVIMACVLGDDESHNLAAQLAAALNTAGWPTTEIRQRGFSGANPIGMGILVRAGTPAPAHAAALERAMTSAGIPIEIAHDPNLEAGTVWLLIGIKPK